MKSLRTTMTLALLVLAVSLLAQSVSAQVPCCQGIRGNANADPEDKVNISDVTYLTSYLFGIPNGPAPICLEEGNVNGDPEEKINISDVTFLTSYLFGIPAGAAPGDCPAQANIVFDDEYGNYVTYQAFGGSFYEAVQVDTDSMYSGTQGLSITIQNTGYSGGAFTTSVPRDLSEFNALTFWAKASMAASLDVIGIGNDNTGTSAYTAQMGGLPLTTEWQKFTIPFPLSAKLDNEAGMFFFAEGPEGGMGYTIWIDEIIFQDLYNLSNVRPEIPTETKDVALGETIAMGNGTVTTAVGAEDVTLSAMPGYFTFESSNTGVVSVAGDGTITAVGEGTATLTALLGTTPATGQITVNVAAPLPEPGSPAPTPTIHADSVISMFSDAYTDVPIGTWSAEWPDMADVETYMIGADSTKKYTNLVYAGVEFYSPPIDASSMTHFHIDVWTPDATDNPAAFKIKLVQFGAPNTEHEVVFDENTMNTGEWISIDIPMSSFSSLSGTDNLQQMIISTNDPAGPKTVYVDNVYFYNAGITEPLAPAPAPTADPGNVISMFSDVYTDVPVSSWSAAWPDMADVADVTVGTDNVKLYTNLVYAGIEFYSPPIDASGMTHFRMDIWTPDATGSPAAFKVKLVQFGAPNTEHEVVFDHTALSTGEWITLDIPMGAFGVDSAWGLSGSDNLQQMIISSDDPAGPKTVYVDNVYFVNVPTEPAAPAPTPSLHSSNVISLFSDAYTDVTVDTWSASWPDMADVADVLVGSDNAKLYTNFVFAGIEFTSSPINAATMTHIHMDVWTPDPTDAPAVFKVKLVDFGPNGVWGADDSEYEITLDENTMNTGEWVSIDIPLADFGVGQAWGLVETEHLAQMVLTSTPNTVWVDNVYLYHIPSAPPVPAPTPTLGSSDVISLFSDAYSDVTVDTWSASWPDMADVADVLVGSDNAKLYTNFVYAGIEFTSSPINATTMTHFHLDVWTADDTDAPAVFKVKLVDFGPNGVWGADDSEYEVTLDESTMNTGSWVSIDIPLSEFGVGQAWGLVEIEHMAQLILTSDPNTVWVDNVYFHK